MQKQRFVPKPGQASSRDWDYVLPDNTPTKKNAALMGKVAKGVLRDLEQRHMQASMSKRSAPAPKISTEQKTFADPIDMIGNPVSKALPVFPKPKPSTPTPPKPRPTNIPSTPSAMTEASSYGRVAVGGERGTGGFPTGDAGRPSGGVGSAGNSKYFAMMQKGGAMPKQNKREPYHGFPVTGRLADPAPKGKKSEETQKRMRKTTTISGRVSTDQGPKYPTGGAGSDIAWAYPQTGAGTHRTSTARISTGNAKARTALKGIAVTPSRKPTYSESAAQAGTRNLNRERNQAKTPSGETGMVIRDSGNAGIVVGNDGSQRASYTSVNTSGGKGRSALKGSGSVYPISGNKYEPKSPKSRTYGHGGGGGPNSKYYMKGKSALPGEMGQPEVFNPDGKDVVHEKKKGKAMKKDITSAFVPSIGVKQGKKRDLQAPAKNVYPPKGR